MITKVRSSDPHSKITVTNFMQSANYCHSHLSDNIGLMLLCETAIDPAIEFFNANYRADEDCKKAGKT